MYPFVIKYSCPSEVTQARNGAQQRNIVRACTVEFDAAFTGIPLADATAINAFFNSQKGRKDTTWNINHNGSSYANCGFLHDAIEWQESAHHHWSARLAWRATPPALSSPPSSLPALASGAITQYGWKRGSSFDTQYGEAADGTRYTLAMRGGGLTGFSSLPVASWVLNFKSVPEAAADRYVSFFRSKGGRYGTFDFMDPDTGTVTTGCHFAADVLEINYNGYNNSSFVLGVEKT